MVGDVVLATGAVTSEGSGRHTTVRRELLLAQGGVLIDTPGLRERFRYGKNWVWRPYFTKLLRLQLHADLLIAPIETNRVAQ